MLMVIGVCALAFGAWLGSLDGAETVRAKDTPVVDEYDRKLAVMVEPGQRWVFTPDDPFSRVGVHTSTVLQVKSGWVLVSNPRIGDVSLREMTLKLAYDLIQEDAK